MTKEVLVSLKGLQTAEVEAAEPVELISKGLYQYDDDKHVVQYEEVDEEDQEITKVTMIFTSEHVEILKQGKTNVQMIFEENQKTTSCYETPYGELMVGIDTSKIDVQENEKHILIKMDYTLDMNYNHVADCTIQIKIMAKGMEEALV